MARYHEYARLTLNENANGFHLHLEPLHDLHVNLDKVDHISTESYREVVSLSTSFFYNKSGRHVFFASTNEWTCFPTSAISVIKGLRNHKRNCSYFMLKTIMNFPTVNDKRKNLFPLTKTKWRMSLFAHGSELKASASPKSRSSSLPKPPREEARIRTSGFTSFETFAKAIHIENPQTRERPIVLKFLNSKIPSTPKSPSHGHAEICSHFDDGHRSQVVGGR